MWQTRCRWMPDGQTPVPSRWRRGRKIQEITVSLGLKHTLMYMKPHTAEITVGAFRSFTGALRIWVSLLCSRAPWQCSKKCPVTSPLFLQLGLYRLEQKPHKHIAPWPGTEPGLQQWERWILTTRPPGRCTARARLVHGWCMVGALSLHRHSWVEIKNDSLSLTNQVFSGSRCSPRHLEWPSRIS